MNFLFFQLLHCETILAFYNGGFIGMVVKQNNFMDYETVGAPNQFNDNWSHLARQPFCVFSALRAQR